MLPRLQPKQKPDPIPSIEHQAALLGFTAGIFDFGYAKLPNRAYFNTSLVKRDDGLWLIARRSRNDPSIRVGQNDIVRIALDGLKPGEISKVLMPWRFMGEHFEDPRATHYDGKTWISACDFIWGKNSQRWTGSHQVLAAFDSQWGCVGRFDIPYGGNGDEIGRNTVHQKNWAFFFHEGAMHFVFHPEPHTVVRLNEDMNSWTEWKTLGDHGWKFGEIRGGSQPYRVGNEYWCFFHSSFPVELGRNTRRYVMGAYSFEAKPPFRMTRITRKPILQGSYNNRMSFDKPPVVFPCGSILAGDEWLVTGGSNDLDTFWCKFNHSQLLQWVKPVISVVAKSGS